MYKITFDHLSDSVLDGILINGISFNDMQDEVDGSILQNKVNLLLSKAHPKSAAQASQIILGSDLTDSEKVITLISGGSSAVEQDPMIGFKMHMDIAQCVEGLDHENGTKTQILEKLMEKELADDDAPGYNLHYLGIALGVLLDKAC